MRTHHRVLPLEISSIGRSLELPVDGFLHREAADGDRLCESL
jgi:hypothetical protein